LISIPFPFLMGWLSDRTGRKKLIMVGYLSTLAAVFVLAISTQLWHFWLAIGLGCITTGTNSIGNALVNDLVPLRSFRKALSIFGAAAWIGGVFGFALAGVSLQNLGFIPTYIIGGCLVVIAVILMVPIRVGSRNDATLEPGHN
jgi:MFS transporter, DHA1 family, multidrug resistance protein